MAFLDFIKNHNASQQPPVTQSPQPAVPSIESLQANVKALAVEAARPAAELMDRATQHRDTSSAPAQLTPPNSASSGRSLGMER
jgi:hypothetical protein